MFGYIDPEDEHLQSSASKLRKAQRLHYTIVIGSISRYEAPISLDTKIPFMTGIIKHQTGRGMREYSEHQ